MQEFIYQVIRQATETLLPENGSLDDIIERFEEVGCSLLIQIFKNLRDLTAPFYTIIYPDLRSDVFHTGDDNTISNLLSPVDSFNKGAGGVKNLKTAFGEPFKLSL